MSRLEKSWLEVTISVRNYGNFTIDEVAGFIADLFEKPVIQVGNIIKIYMESGTSIDQSGLKASLKGFGVEAEVAVRPYEDRSWEKEWKKHLEPLYVGKSLLIRPTWLSVEDNGGRVEVLIDPGMAFGTGHHETTLLCLEWLDEFCRMGRPVDLSLLDVGTGSGILAIAAAKLGFCPVVALDIDTEAVRVAAGNVVLNGVSDKVWLVAGDVDSIKVPFGVIIANIQADVLKGLARSFASRMSSCGFVVLSGLLDYQCRDVIRAYEAAGFRFQGSTCRGEWCLVVFRAPAGGT